MQSVLLGDHWFYVMQDDAKKPQFIKLKANTSEDYVEHWQSIASANWHASAALIAKVVQHALFVDIGSTTSDFTVIKYHKVQANAFTDGARMRAHTLVYTGVVRTSVMSIGQNVAFDGAMTSVAAEHFATSADIYRLTADLIEANDMSDTADGAEKTLEASAKRLARMVGCDASEHDFKTWQALAQGFKMLQFERLLAVADLHLKAHFSDKDPMPIIIGAGVGSFLVKEIAQALGLPFTAVEDYVNALEDSAASPWQGQAQMCVSLPAVAVGLLGVAFLMHHDRECEDGHGS
jgi:probable H4MPT-linked C1 transfer pathway protein